jgi:gamma-glutamylcyclotransferase (GGCT)/AIG2-like uncharacterized protein YtfP
MKMRKVNKLYIAYGSNLNLEQMGVRCPSARVIGGATMKGWRLLFRGAHRGAVATIERYKGGTVPVLVWEITPSDEAALDSYEGFPYLYRKERIRMTVNGKRVYAMVYIMTDGRTPGQPSAGYYSTILAGYNTAGFDVDILRQATVDSAEAYEMAVN